MASSLSQKLQMKPDEPLALLNAPNGYDRVLRDQGVNLDESGGPYCALLLFVSSLAEVETVAWQAMTAVRPDAKMWIAYPKQSGAIKADINRDSLWKAMGPAGWHPVRQIALDETWSAVRFKPDDPEAGEAGAGYSDQAE